VAVVKVIRVSAGQRTSLQRHRWRSENWIVVSGDGHAVIDKRVVQLHPGSVVHVHQRLWHRIAAHKSDLVLIEVQRGERLEEDDIERREDDYGRV
jgi:mannose-6-phosphate isomerase